MDGECDVNLAQIRAGLAWHYKQYGKTQQFSDHRLYAEAEELARREGIGLWGDPAPVAPWKFRRNPKAIIED